MKYLIAIILLTMTCKTTLFCGLPEPPINPTEKTAVVEVDFLKGRGFKYNALGPHIVKVDPSHNRIIIACVNSSALAVYDSETDQTTTIPIGSRMPRRLHYLGVAVDPNSGLVYLAGDKKLIVVDPNRHQTAVTELPADFETVAVDPKTGKAFLVGRTTADLAIVSPGTEKPCLITWGDATPPLSWVAATPPPPIRNIVVDEKTRRVFVVDGIVPQLVSFHADDGKILTTRKLPIKNYARWHFAGFDPQNHWIYFALEDATRNSRQALRIDLRTTDDIVVDLPTGSSEPVGVNCSILRQEIYIPYDNNKHVHRVRFAPEIKVDSIAVPSFGMDASAVDEQNKRLFVTSWSQAALYVIDIVEGTLMQIVPDFPVYPHMNHLAFNPTDGKLYIPTGAAVVNGTFGASITVFNPNQNEFSRIITGWGPVSLAQQPNSEAFYVFNSDRQFALVQPDGHTTYYNLPHPYAHDAVRSLDQTRVYVAYGPHSSMWPAVYIGGTRNGIFTIGADPLDIADRITDRLAHHIMVDHLDQIWALQNTWGTEHPFVSVFPAGDENWERIMLPEKVENECIYRLLANDPESGRIYAGRLGDRSTEPGLVYVIDAKTHQVIDSVTVGLTPTDIGVLPGKNKLFITNFDSDSISIIDGASFRAEMKATDHKPFAIAVNTKTNTVYVVNHLGNSLSIFGDTEKVVALPEKAMPNNLIVDESRDRLFMTAHNSGHLKIYQYDPLSGNVITLFDYAYPYGEVKFDQANSAFGERAQWGDSIFKLTSMVIDSKGRLWVADYLAGKLWILSLP